MRSESAGPDLERGGGDRCGEESGAEVQISHLKACGQSNYGLAIDALEMIEDARGRGVDVTADQYPYIANARG